MSGSAEQEQESWYNILYSACRQLRLVTMIAKQGGSGPGVALNGGDDVASGGRERHTR